MKRGVKIGLVLLAALAAALLVCLCLYDYDNKYTRPGPQPIAGILYLDEAQAAADSVHYLIYEWEYYPDALLAPGDFEGAAQPTPAEYAYIGGYTNYAAGRAGHAPGGQASYRLHLMLPAESARYSLLVPDIYCAYRLYVDGQLLARAGSPDANSYRAALGTRVVTFEGAGHVELLVACAGQGYITGGMTHPIGLGTPAAVQRTWALGLLVRGAACAVCLLLAGMFVYIRISAGYKNGLLYSLLCLCFLAVSGVALLRMLGPRALQPYSALYLAGYYAMFLGILLLQANLWGLPFKAKLACGLVGGGVALLAVALACLPVPSQWQIGAFSTVSGLYKWAMALAMLLLALWAAARDVPFSGPVLFGVAFFGFALAMDRLLPAYEPVLGGWFAQVAGFVVLCLLGLVLWQDMVRAMRDNASYVEALAQADRQLALLREHYKALDEQTGQLRAVHHDFRQHRILMQSYVDTEDYAALKRFLAEYSQSLPQDIPIHYTDQDAVNILTRHYAALCRQEGIDFAANYDIGAHIGLVDAEINVVLGNLLENAVAACRRVAPGARRIQVAGAKQAGKLVLTVRNSCVNAPRRKGGQGLKSIAAVAQKHGGTALFAAEDGTFRATVIIGAH